MDTESGDEKAPNVDLEVNKPLTPYIESYTEL